MISYSKISDSYFGPEDVLAYYPRRKSDSHKGQNGRLLIIGGSKEFHGAPILSILGAQSIGVDLIYVFVPKCHEEITKNFSPEIMVQSFERNSLCLHDVKKIIDQAKRVDACLIGPGLGGNLIVKESVIEILSKLKIPCVIDADAILNIDEYKNIPKGSLFTPHKKEFIRLGEISDQTVLIKGNVDLILYNNIRRKNKTGSAVLTRGGTGDVLSGICAALISRGVDAFNAAGIASFLLGYASEQIESQNGEGFLLKDLCEKVSIIIKSIIK